MSEEIKVRTMKLKNGLIRLNFEPGIKLGDFFAMMRKERENNDE